MTISEPHTALLDHLSTLARLGVIVPTYNAGENWWALHAGLEKQGLVPSQVLIVDSSSSDHTRSLARQAGYQVLRIRKEDFSHGPTRQLACSYLPEAEFLVYLTQDAILAAPDALEKLCLPFEDPQVGAVYGRQLPRQDADPIERHGRLFNYPDQSYVRTFEDRERLGFRTVFFSNSFAVYRRTALEEVGGFPSDAIVSEEVTVVARMLEASWKIAYQAEALAIHSHPLNLQREFCRYFDIGVQHGRQRWLLATFGGTKSDGVRYVRSEFRFLSDFAPFWVPYAALRHATKFLAYKLGTKERLLPMWLRRACSNYPGFWDQGCDRLSDETLLRKSQPVEARDQGTSRAVPEVSKP